MLDRSRESSSSHDGLAPAVYEQLREIAHRHLRRASSGGRDATLATTALVHEAWLKLVVPAERQWHDEAHFLATAAMAMRQILVDRARALATAKRGGAAANVTFDEEAIALASDSDALLDVDDALGRLAEVSPRLARVVEYRFYGGMTEDQIAAVLQVTSRTVQRDWLKARMLLRRAIAGERIEE